MATYATMPQSTLRKNIQAHKLVFEKHSKGIAPETFAKDLVELSYPPTTTSATILLDSWTKQGRLKKINNLYKPM